MAKRSHPRPGRAGCRRGLRTSPAVGPGACIRRAALNVHDDGQPSEMGYRRCHGEGGAGDRPPILKPMLEASVRKESPRERERCQTPVGFCSPTGCARYGRAAARSRVGRQSVQPGVKSDTYSTKGNSTEHGNLAWSARLAGWPPSPAILQAGGGAFVVVRARESRVHGEGRQ
jgi:hypothetical protein